MGSLFGGKKKSTTSSRGTQRVYLPPWIDQPIQDLTSEIRGLAGTPYPDYQGDRLAGFTPDELEAFRLTRELIGTGLEDNARAIDITREVADRGLGGFSQEQLQPWMNPYIENVLDISRRRQFESFDRQQQALRDRAAQAAAFGGSRFGLQEAQQSQDFQRQLAETEQQALFDSFERGIGRAMQGAQMAGQGAVNLSNLGGQERRNAIQDAGLLQNIGATQRLLEQTGLDIAYQDFMNEQAYPFEQAAWQQQMLLPIGNLVRGQDTTQTNTTTQSGGSKLGKIAGIASLVAAPFTGGASLMGGMGGLASTGSGIASMLGMGGNVLNSIGGGMMGHAGTFTDFLGGFGGSGGVPIPAMKPFKDGGLVTSAKFEEGGQVDGGGGAFGKLLTALTLSGMDDDEVLNLLQQEELMQRALMNKKDPVQDELMQRVLMEKGRNTNNPFADLEKEYNLPSGLLDAIYYAETSRGTHPTMVSEAGAIGPFQFTPITMKHLGMTEEDAWDLDRSSRFAAQYLREMGDRFDEDWPRAVAGYNVGPTFIANNGLDNLPDETRGYLDKVLPRIGYKDGGTVLGRIYDYLNEKPLYERPIDFLSEEYLYNRLPDLESIKNFAKDKGVRMMPGAGSVKLGVDFFDSGLGLGRMFRGEQSQKQQPQFENVPIPSVKPDIDNDTGKEIQTLKNMLGGGVPVPSSKPAKGEEEEKKEGSTLNLPLLMFGASLLSEQEGFFGELGRAAGVYGKSVMTKEEAQREKAKEMFDQKLAERRVAAYEMQNQLARDKATSPFAKMKQQLELQKLMNQVSGNDRQKEIDKRIDDTVKLLLDNGLSRDIDEAKQIASQYVLGELQGPRVQNVEEYFGIN